MNFKNIKIDSALHENLKSFCKDKGVFIQEWLENLISEKIKNKDITMFNKTINEFNFIANQQVPENLNSNIVYFFDPSFEIEKDPYHHINYSDTDYSIGMHIDIKEANLKVEKFDNEELFRSKISNYILDLIKQAPSDFEDLIYLEPKNDESIKKMFYKIMRYSNTVASKSRYGQANYVFMNPSVYNIMLEYNNRTILGFTNEKLDIDKNYSFVILNSRLNDMKIIVDSSLSIFDIYLGMFSSEITSPSLKLFYNYSGCKHDEINYVLSHSNNLEKNCLIKIKFEYLDKSKNNIEYIHSLLNKSFFDVKISDDRDFNVGIFSTELNRFNIHGRFNHDVMKKYFLAEQFSTLRDFLYEKIKHMSEHIYDVSYIKNSKEYIIYIDGLLSVFIECDQTDFYVITNGFIASELFNEQPNYGQSDFIYDVSIPYYTGVYVLENKNIHVHVDPFMKYNDHRIIFMNKKIKAKIYKQSHPQDDLYANYMTINEDIATYHSGINYDLDVNTCSVMKLENLNI